MTWKKEKKFVDIVFSSSLFSLSSWKVLSLINGLWWPHGRPMAERRDVIPQEASHWVCSFPSATLIPAYLTVNWKLCDSVPEQILTFIPTGERCLTLYPLGITSICLTLSHLASKTSQSCPTVVWMIVVIWFTGKDDFRKPASFDRPINVTNEQMNFYIIIVIIFIINRIVLNV